MYIQKSYQAGSGGGGGATGGTLYLVATPIGNLEDITLRALRTLREVDWIAAEDTRHTRKLLSFYEISARLKSYHEHNKRESGSQLLDMLKQGQSVALVSDAGMPAISDPGYELVCLALAHELPVVPIPGANAALSALIVSGLPSASFTFVGFLPRDKKNLRAALQARAAQTDTLIFYEAPHRVKTTLAAMLEVWGERSCVLARELTKRYEEIARGPLSACLTHVQEHGAQGEFCLVIEGAPPLATSVNTEQIEQDPTALVRQRIAAGSDEKQAIREVAAQLGLPKRVVYNEFVARKKS